MPFYHRLKFQSQGYLKFQMGKRVDDLKRLEDLKLLGKMLGDLKDLGKRLFD